MNKVAFIGHRNVLDISLREKLYKVVEKQVLDGNCHFIMGTHGEFDKLALSVCRELKKIYPNISIEVVLTSITPLKKKIYDGEQFSDLSTFKLKHPDFEDEDFKHLEIFSEYDDVQTKMYDIEQEHYKKRITTSNKKMIDESGTAICYVDCDRSRSGAKLTYKYAQKKGLKTINLFKSFFNAFF